MQPHFDHLADYDVIIIGAGHAGIEAAHAAAVLGASTAVFTLTLDLIGNMPCNPSIGGTAKGHLVREVDALGGLMGLAADATFLQSRMLNRGKGPAVHSLRVQTDRKRYHIWMKHALETTPNLAIHQAEITGLDIQGGAVRGVYTQLGGYYGCKAVVIATGTTLGGRIFVGESHYDSGPDGTHAATALTRCLVDNGFTLRRFKTGTPARVHRRSIDFSKLECQPGDPDDQLQPFSFLTRQPMHNKVDCHIAYTNADTHRVILENLSRSPLYGGDIQGVGPRYCPSIEDKVVRFKDKERHPIFMEPEGLNTNEWYAQGMSTSMPEEIQRAIYATVPGLERAKILRLAYAIEYDCIDPQQLNLSFRAREIEGLYFAGQINGTSGYEEAAAQGLYAGMNAALWLSGREPMILTRADAYIGVLVDDLVTKGTDEPYRMMTSRAEYRLLLRQDNADLRLTRLGYEAGLASQERLRRMEEKRDQTAAAIDALKKLHLVEKLRRTEESFDSLRAQKPELNDFPPEIKQQAEIEVKYEGYISRQLAEEKKFRRMEKVPIPADADYLSMSGLRIEARQKLDRQRPASLGQASRIPGVSPGDITVLMIWLKSLGCRPEEDE